MEDPPQEARLPLREKVFAYVTRGRDLLVFREREFEQFGKQIPAGSPKENESLESAVIREAREETGLTALTIGKYLGSIDVDQTKYGINEIQRRHFYHLMTSEKTPETWVHEEKDPSIRIESTPDRIIFDLWWISLEEEFIALAEGHDAFLADIIDYVTSSDKQT
ncbi:MAG: NUDIX domain-containing protein [Promethearchaeota archaeon]